MRKPFVVDFSSIPISSTATAFFASLNSSASEPEDELEYELEDFELENHDGRNEDLDDEGECEAEAVDELGGVGFKDGEDEGEEKEEEDPEAGAAELQGETYPRSAASGIL